MDRAPTGVRSSDASGLPGPCPAVAQEVHPLRRTRRAAVLFIGLITAVALALTAGSATTEPAAIETQRAEVAHIQGELDRINLQVSEAAEAHNGAVYELQQVRGRIRDNSGALATSERELADMQAQLEERLRQLYTRGDRSVLQVLITSGSLSEAMQRQELLERVGEHDARVVARLTNLRVRLTEIRRELVDDREAATEQLARRAAERERIEGLLAERERVLGSANARLQRLIAVEEERQRREAAEQARLARQRQAAQEAQERAAAQAREAAAPASPSAAAPSAPSTPSEPAGSPSPAPAAPSEPAPASSLPSGEGNARAASIAMQFLGVPYRWGGADPSGFDCSGLASYAYAQIGKSVPHYTVAIYNAFPKVPAGSLQPGDLVFWRGLGHMGIYIGGGQYVNAPQTGDVVKVSSMSSRSDYVGAVRP